MIIGGSALGLWLAFPVPVRGDAGDIAHPTYVRVLPPEELEEIEMQAVAQLLIGVYRMAIGESHIRGWIDTHFRLKVFEEGHECKPLCDRGRVTYSVPSVLLEQSFALSERFNEARVMAIGRELSYHWKTAGKEGIVKLHDLETMLHNGGKNRTLNASLIAFSIIPKMVQVTRLAEKDAIRKKASTRHSVEESMEENGKSGNGKAMSERLTCECGRRLSAQEIAQGLRRHRRCAALAVDYNNARAPFFTREEKKPSVL